MTQDLGALLDRAPLALEQVRPLLKNLARCLQRLHESGERWDQSELGVHVADDYSINCIGTISERKRRLGPGQIDPNRDFVSPEYIESANEDPRSDIWAWGNVAYESVTGKRPFTGKSVHGTMTAALRSEANPACEVNPECPRELSGIIERALKKSPDQRWQSAQELFEALEAASW